MTTYISGTTSTATSSPFAAFSEANPLFSLWTLPLTLTQTWIAAWVKSDEGDTERLLDSAQGDQLPVPAAIQESSDSTTYA